MMYRGREGGAFPGTLPRPCLLAWLLLQGLAGYEGDAVASYVPREPKTP